MSKWVVMVWERGLNCELELEELSGIIHDTKEEAQKELDRAHEVAGYFGKVEKLGHLDAIDKIEGGN